MGRLGGSLVTDSLETLRDEVRNYFGVLNEIRAGLNPKVPDKPVALRLFEQCREMGIPLISGGLVDQPHIWLREYAICLQETQLWQAMLAKQSE